MFDSSIDDALYKEIGAMLREERERQGLTLATVSERIGCSIRAVSRWETGERKIKYSVLHQLCLAYHIPPDAFIEHAYYCAYQQLISESGGQCV